MMIHGLHQEPNYGPRYELHYGIDYRLSYTAMHAGTTTVTAPLHNCTGRPQQTYNAVHN